MKRRAASTRSGAIVAQAMLVLSLVLLLEGCGPVLEATRPDPVDISQFVPGETRFDVVAKLGAPIATVPNNGQSCDVYQLYTRGPGSAGKGALAAGEAVGDVLTLGLAEVVWTPVEAATRNSKHPVTFCYDSNNKLVSVLERDSS
jgi:hypothetical protein